MKFAGLKLSLISFPSLYDVSARCVRNKFHQMYFSWRLLSPCLERVQPGQNDWVCRFLGSTSKEGHSYLIVNTFTGQQFIHEIYLKICVVLWSSDHRGVPDSELFWKIKVDTFVMRNILYYYTGIYLGEANHYLRRHDLAWARNEAL